MRKDPREWGTDCKSCPFFNAQNFKPVTGDIPKGAIGVLVGEHPSSDDVTFGRPFSGNTGKELDRSLDAIGLPRKDLAVVHSACCRPPPDSGPDEKVRAAKCCKPALLKQLEGLEEMPKFLMGQGSVAPFMPLVKGGVDSMRGFIREKENAIISYAPQYAFFRNPYAWATFETDLARFKRLIDNTLEPGPTEIVTAPTIDSLRRLVESAPGFLAVDIETAPLSSEEPWTGKDPTRAVLRSIGFGTPHSAVSFLWEEATVEMMQETKRLLADSTLIKVLQNGFFFDIRVLRRYGMEVNNCEDTRDMRCALSVTSELSLRYLASIYCDFPAWKESEDEK